MNRLLISLVVIASLVTFGCGQGEQQQEGQQTGDDGAGEAQASYTDNPWTQGENLSGSTVTIFGAFVEPGSDYFIESMSAFEEQTGIEVEYNGSGDFESLISVRVEGGDPPDIASFAQPGLLEDMVRRGHIQDLNDWFDRSFLEEHYDDSWLEIGTMEDIMLRTVPPEQYDAWVEGDLPFNSEEVKRAANIMGEIWFNEDFVLGGTQSILTVPFGDAVEPLFRDPPQAWLHRQASFITDFFPEDAEVGEDVNFFYLPPIDEEEGKPVLGAGDIMAAFEDRPEVRAVMRYLATGESIKMWVQSGGVVAPHKDAKLEWYPTEANRRYAEILQNADTFRFDGSDMMPGQVGTGAFWNQMTNWVGGSDLETVLGNIDQAWPEEER